MCADRHPFSAFRNLHRAIRPAAAWLCLCFSLCLSALPAQEAIEGVLEIARAGNADRAEEECRKILANQGASPALKAAVDFIRAENLLTRALGQTELKAAQDLLDDSIVHLERFLKTQPSAQLAMEARRGIDWRRQKKAERTAAALKLEGDARRLAEIRERSLELYAGLEVHFGDRIRALSAAAPGPQSQQELLEVRLDLPRAELAHSRLVGTDEDKRRRLLQSAIARLQDFQLDHCDSAVAFEACWLEGQCFAELGETKRAETRFQNAVLLRERLSRAGIEPNAYCLNIVRGASVSLTEALFKAEDYQRAAQAVDRALREDADLERERAGQALKLLKAECLAELEDLPGAQDLAGQVIAAGVDPRIAAAARERLKVWAADPRLKGSLSDAERMLGTAESLMEKEDWLPAIKSLRAVLEGCATKEEEEKYGSDAYYRQGLCYARLGRNYEAAFAYQRLFTLFPKAELAPRACFEAVRALASEEAISGDGKDGELKEKYLALLLEKWPEHPSARNVAFLKAEKAEKEKDYRRAAELYLEVREDAEAYEASLIAGARSWYFHAAGAAEAKEGEKPAEEAELKSYLLKAEEALGKFFARAASPGQPRDLAKLRENLTFLATQQLALVYTHEAVGKNGECLKLLEEYSGKCRPGDPRLARIWALEIRARLGLKQVDEAVKVLDGMIDRFPQSASVPAASRSVAISLDRLAEERIRKKDDPAAVREDLRRAGRYYLKWLREGPSRGAKLSPADLRYLAEALYTLARRLNGLDDSLTSFLDVPAGAVKERQYFQDAASVQSLLLEGKGGKLADKERLTVLTRRARCASFTASEPEDWQKARALYHEIVTSFKLFGASRSISKLDLQALQANPGLLPVYLELGEVYHELGRRGQGFQVQNARTVFNNVIAASAGGSEPWWIAKYLQVKSLFETGKGDDVRMARTILDNLEKNYPDYDADQFRIKGRLLELKGKVLRVTG